MPGDSSFGLFHSISVIPLMHATNPTQRQWRLGARADLASEPTGRNRQSPWQPWKDVMNTELSQTTHATASIPSAVRFRSEGQCGWTGQETLR